MVIKITKDMSEDDREYVKSLKKEVSALKKAHARAKRHPVRRVKNWTETKTPPFTRMDLSDTFNMVPALIVIKPDGKIRYLEDRNTYK